MIGNKRAEYKEGMITGMHPLISKKLNRTCPHQEILVRQARQSRGRRGGHRDFKLLANR